MRVVVTGASGFIGSALVEKLADEGHSVVAPVRTGASDRRSRVQYISGADLSDAGSWLPALAGAEAVIHLAARVHRISDKAANPLAEYRRDNVEGTLALAQRAAEAGVKRFVFISSIKVNGERTKPGRPFRADALPAPKDPYGISKLEAEQALFALGRERDLEIVVVRPPLVYGPGVKGNFLTMMTLLSKRIPLPLGAVNVKRSLVASENLVDLLSLCLHHPQAPRQVLLVSDGQDMSVSEMLRRLSGALGQPARLLPVPPVLLKSAAWALGRQDIALRLCSSLEVDSEPTCRQLGWKPPVRVDEAFQRTADHFRACEAT